MGRRLLGADELGTPARDEHQRRHPLDEVLRFEIPMHDIVIVQVLYAFEDVANNLGGISLCELATTRDLLKQFSA